MCTSRIDVTSPHVLCVRCLKFVGKYCAMEKYSAMEKTML